MGEVSQQFERKTRTYWSKSYLLNDLIYHVLFRLTVCIFTPLHESIPCLSCDMLVLLHLFTYLPSHNRTPTDHNLHFALVEKCSCSFIMGNIYEFFSLPCVHMISTFDLFCTIFALLWALWYDDDSLEIGIYRNVYQIDWNVHAYISVQSTNIYVIHLLFNCFVLFLCSVFFFSAFVLLGSSEELMTRQPHAFLRTSYCKIIIIWALKKHHIDRKIYMIKFKPIQWPKITA